jgi:hypothetical protein
MTMVMPDLKFTAESKSGFLAMRSARSGFQTGFSIKSSADCRKLVIQHTAVTVVAVTCTWTTGFLPQILQWQIAKLDNSNALQMNKMFSVFLFCLVPFSPHKPIFGAQNRI